MAQRLKYIVLNETNLTNNATVNVSNHTSTNQPSTAGDIATRVLIDRIEIDFPDGGMASGGMPVAFSLLLNRASGGIMTVASFASNYEVGSYTIRLIGSNNDTPWQNTLSGLRWFNFTGTGSMSNNLGITYWTVPAQFYTKPGDYLSIYTYNSSAGTQTVRASLVCISEY